MAQPPTPPPTEEPEHSSDRANLPGPAESPGRSPSQAAAPARKSGWRIPGGASALNFLNRPAGSAAKTPIYRDLVVLQLVVLVFLLDQFSKFLVQELLPLRASFPYDGLFRFTHTYNTGSAFGILQGQNTPLIFVSFVGIVILALIYRSQARPSNLLRFSLSLQLGGAFGNLLDRVRLGHVTDFIDIGPWPVFNLADASIVSGLLLLAWVFLRPEQTPPTSVDVAPEPAEGSSSVLPAHPTTVLPAHPTMCPVCEDEMVDLPNGWRCIACGARERIDHASFSLYAGGEETC